MRRDGGARGATHVGNIRNEPGAAGADAGESECEVIDRRCLRVRAEITTNSATAASSLAAPGSLNVSRVRFGRRAPPSRRKGGLGAVVLSARPLSVSYAMEERRLVTSCLSVTIQHQVEAEDCESDRSETA